MNADAADYLKPDRQAAIAFAALVAQNDYEAASIQALSLDAAEMIFLARLLNDLFRWHTGRDPAKALPKWAVTLAAKEVAS